MKAKLSCILVLFCLSFALVSSQEESTLREPSSQIVNAPRLIVPRRNIVLDPSAFPRRISPQDIALTTGNFLIHFTSARFQLADTGPEHVDLILEGYIANYSNANQDFFDGDFRLFIGQTEFLANTDIMSQLKAEYGDSRDYPGRNLPFAAQLGVPARSVHFIYVAYRIPAESRDVRLQVSYQNGHQSQMRLLLIPADEDGTADVTVYKLEVGNVAQYLLLEPIEGEAVENGLSRNILDPFRFDNCSREPANINYDTYSASEKQRLQNFQLTVSPETDVTRFLTIFGLLIFSEHVEASLFELNYQRFESSREMVSQGIQSTTTVRALTAFHYQVLEQPMRRVDTFRVQYGSEILEFPYTIDYSMVKVETYQEDISTEYCEARQ